MAKLKNTKDVLDRFTEVVERCIPKTCLPMSYADHQDLACAMVIDLAGSVCLVDKGEYNKMVRRLQQLDRYEQAIFHGVLYSPLRGIGQDLDEGSISQTPLYTHKSK